MRKHLASAFTFLKSVALGALSIASGGSTVVIALYYYLWLGEDPPSKILPMFLASAAVVSAWALWWRERRRWQELIRDRGPRLTIASTSFVSRDVSWGILKRSGQGAPEGSSDASWLQVRVENAPQSLGQQRATAKEVAARMTVSQAQSGADLFTSEGWWLDYTKDAFGQTSIEYARRKHIAPGSSEVLALAFKFGWESFCYGLSPESTAFPHWVRSDLALATGDYLIVLGLVGENLSQQFRLTFNNPGAGSGLRPLSCEGA